MLRLWTAIKATCQREEGASMVEYALLIALIAIVAIVAVTLVGTSISEEFQSVADTL